MTRELKSNECNGTCSWHETDEQLDGLQVFACKGCGSEWTPDLGWTPRNADGEVSPEVSAAKAISQPRTAIDEAAEGCAGGGSVGSW